MSLSNRVTEKDMPLMPGILKFVFCENISLRFEYGKQTVCGIPADFSPKVSHRMLTENIAQYIIEGTDEHGLTIRAEYPEYRDFPVTEWAFYLTNNGNKDTSVLKNIRIEGELACPDAFKDFEDRIAIISGEAKVTPETARKILRSIYFYPPPHSTPTGAPSAAEPATRPATLIWKRRAC